VNKLQLLPAVSRIQSLPLVKHVTILYHVCMSTHNNLFNVDVKLFLIGMTFQRSISRYSSLAD
jgi:hypothetical protein